MKKNKNKKSFPKTLLRIRVPKQNETGPMAFEQLLASFHGIIAKSTKSVTDQAISFEISHINGQIYFYVCLPKHLSQLVASQFYAQYKNLEIETVPEYFVKNLIKNKSVVSAELKPNESWLYPFKRYTQFVDQNTQKFEDPLSGITSALAHLPNKKDGAVIQFVISPVNKRWNFWAKKMLQKLFTSGAWKWEFFQKWYQWAALHPDRNTRLKRIPIKWSLLFFGKSNYAKVYLE